MIKYHHPRYLFRRYEIMRRVKGGRCFLEIGPGNLALAQELLDKFETGVLLDFNTTAVELIYNGLPEARKQRLKLIIADFLTYEGFAEPFDCVVACEVMEHVEDDPAFLHKVGERMARGGQLVLSVPARMKFWAADDELAGHFRRYEKGLLLELLTEAGFSHAEIVSYGFPFQNLIRLLRVGFARLRRRERSGWDKKRQSQESAFLLKRSRLTDALGLLVNRYTFYPLSLFASLFNHLDWAEGYVATAIKGTPS